MNNETTSETSSSGLTEHGTIFSSDAIHEVSYLVFLFLTLYIEAIFSIFNYVFGFILLFLASLNMNCLLLFVLFERV